MMKNLIINLIINHYAYKTTNKFTVPNSTSVGENSKQLLFHNRKFLR
ncbi:MAG: hypothetical protein AVDCRST_MAG74-2189 [uncultured Pyrinomonadaceae bacterium]|uniref:Uncharacterized protein n=1 Tax=uncultured Pyrinomonadaceae bacterium TaxID=2283094 RepID=A0A6J4P9N7_9BACT|nr:MAG: hypothetical protein AVDCRST_MAG74-2189 [uncultured Pyrinomonadaceae bacterium]